MKNIIAIKLENVHPQSCVQSRHGDWNLVTLVDGEHIFAGVEDQVFHIKDIIAIDNQHVQEQ